MVQKEKVEVATVVGEEEALILSCLSGIHQATSLYLDSTVSKTRAP